ncbi:DUF2577 family protein [Cytobacillus firmus]|uniref:DUF2577 family protein n=1 Tax=Cytobacillus firmus TaxID=1399 RepID=UPI003BA2021C
MDKRINIEGSGASKIVQLMRKHGYNKDLDTEIATVVSPLPNLSVKLASDGLVLERSDLVVAEWLTEHTRLVLLNGSPTEITFQAQLVKGDRVIVICADESQQYFVIDKAVE